MPLPVEDKTKTETQTDRFVQRLRSLLQNKPLKALKEWVKFLGSKAGIRGIAKARRNRREELTLEEHDWFMSELEVKYVRLLQQLITRTYCKDKDSQQKISEALTSLLKKTAKESSDWCNEALHGMSVLIEDENFVLEKRVENHARCSFKEEVMEKYVGAVMGPVGKIVQDDEGRFKVILNERVDSSRWDQAASCFNEAAEKDESLLGPDHRTHSANDPDKVSSLLGTLSQGELSALILHYELE